MSEKHWINKSQPQTLMIAIILSYVNAVFAVLSLFSGVNSLPFSALALILIVPLAQGGAAIGMANDSKIAWRIAIVLAVSVFALIGYIALMYSVIATNIIGVIFDVAMLVLLIHDHTRKYVNVWFH